VEPNREKSTTRESDKGKICEKKLPNKLLGSAATPIVEMISIGGCSGMSKVDSVYIRVE